MIFTMAQPGKKLRIGAIAPDFKGLSTVGEISFYEHVGSNWAILLFFPDDFAPVATTELVMFAQMQAQLAERGVKIIAVAAQNTLDSSGPRGYKDHRLWVKDINEIALNEMLFPLVSDWDGKIFQQYNLVDQGDVQALQEQDSVATNIAFQSRTIFIIGPQRHVRLAFNYPAAVGINPSEILRSVDCLQTAYKADVRLPANWVPGRQVIIPKKIGDEKALETFGEFNTMTSYLRFAPLPIEATALKDAKKIGEEERKEFLQTAA